MQTDIMSYGNWQQRFLDEKNRPMIHHNKWCFKGYHSNRYDYRHNWFQNMKLSILT